MVDDDQNTNPDAGADAGVSVNLSDFPAITEALQFSSGEDMLASLGIQSPSADDTAVA